MPGLPNLAPLIPSSGPLETVPGMPAEVLLRQDHDLSWAYGLIINETVQILESGQAHRLWLRSARNSAEFDADPFKAFSVALRHAVESMRGLLSIMHPDFVWTDGQLRYVAVKVWPVARRIARLKGLCDAAANKCGRNLRRREMEHDSKHIHSSG
ncbi:hypothetical protein AURDEDRAFT_177923 [Auricularia subglabra TFB-10046 SS5]|uniref:Uncharacterized protein n=1 Tax=Auricularia subglabra (strain TFB-10046 / SS5) TaxID=717982 RepID=J0D2W5_AURST|nr:hypothetical protein AURDEDRAFT_177923 [Auricularia subglabra TFB-10046 SS5]